MRTTLTTLLLSAFLLMGCAEDSSFLTSPETQTSQQSNSPNWVKLPTDLGQGFSVETEYYTEKVIKGKNGGLINQDVKTAEIKVPPGQTPNARYGFVR